jgi:hypothetical protein
VALRQQASGALKFEFFFPTGADTAQSTYQDIVVLCMSADAHSQRSVDTEEAHVAPNKVS